MRLAALRQKKSLMLHDADILCDAPESHKTQPALLPSGAFLPDHFSPDYWRARGQVTGEAPGRGSSLFITPYAGAAEQWVLRPYRRGGLVARLSRARYLWTGIERTRAFREIRLTARLFTLGLPVPRPVAVCVTRHGPAYEAALITWRIAGAGALAERLANATATPSLLERVGRMIRRFHDAGLDHVDLNARNILIDADDTPWLIDLDRCRLRAPGKWQRANLTRLERSLNKFVDLDAAAHAGEHIIAGYRG
ncbi:MAG: 3-deoxy-D-manno-octulosonic acid kinase [Halomonas sp.]|nr:3-deoxy-D-manno-octulosonic acid kinase [Halomonas sp.]MDN6298637.1 3-deoxy-D-manno-octulosonic acid kinase [Halomonas sp.]MDN6315839.1 3-deoxy-D-manno-octulosonic acid kinase [Halomonas sp.]MDN6337258.1 3-deoxy-D-manno-octulosonic acid kinase [Halomonas sp.]